MSKLSLTKINNNISKEFNLSINYNEPEFLSVVEKLIEIDKSKMRHTKKYNFMKIILQIFKVVPLTQEERITILKDILKETEN